MEQNSAIDDAAGEDSKKTLKNKLCSVCGDRALGYNFNALTCESCKAFFRRNALKNKEFKCPFSDECEVTLVTRRFCQKCRLKKCFDIGMKKEWILSDEEKVQKRIKIEENRAKKRSEPSSEMSPDKSDMAAAAAVLLDLHPGSSSSSAERDLPPGGSGERPQARVLPSARSASADGIPRRKVGRLETHPVAVDAAPSPSEETSLSGSGSLPATPSSSSLIKQELLTSNSPTFSDPPTQTSSQFAMENQQQAIDFTLQDTSASDDNQTGVLQYLEPNAHHDSSSTSSPRQFERLSENHYFGQGSMKPCGSGRGFPSSLNNHSIIPDFSQSNNLDEIVAVAIEAEFHVQSIQFQAGRDRDLNDQEQARMHELFLASRALVEPLDLEKTPLSAEPNNLISVINLTDLAIKRIIRMAKKITPFINMCQEDQIALLKGGCTELMILRSVINYNPDKNSWRLPSKDHPRELSMELLKEASQLGVNLYEEHQRFVKSFDPQWRTDENVMLLLSAIALFTPTRVNVMHQDVVKYEQDTYYYLLRRYLETVCRGCEPRRAYLHLIGRLQDLHRLNESHIQLFLEVNPKLVEPLLIEIFDLNP